MIRNDSGDGSTMIPRSATARWSLACLAFAATTVGLPAHAEPEPTMQGSRPRIGLVLGGGGAKGAAHVGVIRVLDELRIPIDCIVGTSVGALVGGTFASGMNAEELEAAIRSISWSGTIAFEGQRARLPMRRSRGPTQHARIRRRTGGSRRPPDSSIPEHRADDPARVAQPRHHDFDRLPIRTARLPRIQSGECRAAEGDLRVRCAPACPCRACSRP
jgi:hypothetical protein